MPEIVIQKTVFNKDSYGRVIDTRFTQLVNQGEEEVPSFSIDDFFELYNQLFYQIPKDGDTLSHQFILQKEADYLGVNLGQDEVQALLEEITSLRQQLLDTQQIVKDLSK